MSGILTFNVSTISASLIVDAYGVAIEPTPIILSGVQSFDITLKGSLEQIRSDRMYAITGVRDSASIEGKIKAVQSSAEALNTLYLGQGVDSTTPFRNVLIGQTAQLDIVNSVFGSNLGIILRVEYEGPHSILPAGAVVSDLLGITDVNGYMPFARTADTQNVKDMPGFYAFGDGPYPGIGWSKKSVALSQYDANLMGVPGYTYDSGRPSFQPYVSFTYLTPTLPVGTQQRYLEIKNLQSGSTPVIQLIASASFQGRKCTLIFPRTVSSNFSLLSQRSLEFSGFDVDFTCYPDLTYDGVLMQAFFLE